MVFMSFAASSQLKKWFNLGITVLFFTALLVSLWMIADALQNSTRFEHLYLPLLLVNISAFLALFALIVLKLRTLVHQVQKKRAGARLTVRLVVLLVMLAMLPVIILYYFSLEFLRQRLDSWSDINIEQALINALELSRTALDSRLRETLKRTEATLKEIVLKEEVLSELNLDDLRSRSGASELTILAPNGHIIASNSTDMSRLLPHAPPKRILLHLKQADSYVNLEPLMDGGLYVRVVLKFNYANQVRLLSMLFPINERLGELTHSVETAFVRYKERLYLQKHLDLNLTLVLSLVLLLTLASAVWVAFFAARRFVAPLSNLADGTRAVASGDYEKQLPVSHFDELGFLVQSFNEMTRKIAQVRDEVKQSQQLADSQRIYLETVLERLSSGVISLDYEQRLRTANLAANDILGLPLSELLGKTLSQLKDDYPVLASLCQALHPHVFKNAQDWCEEITIFGTSGRRILLCRGTQLKFSSHYSHPSGYVIVFEDVTAIVKAQRDAAWSEVARRLAHEIKNPLTPIQLSAERLRHKYLPKFSEKEAEPLDRLTHTIIQQVESLKEMVNAFSNYAKTPMMQWQHLNVNELIKEVLELYRQYDTPFHLIFGEVPQIEADRGRLRQVLHNLIKNALEATTVGNAITITTHHLIEVTFECVELKIQDQGPGIPPSLLDKVFEPYVTTKSKGTGLGLAIVKKMIEEHGGMVWIESLPTGTCVIVRLPVSSKRANEDSAQELF